MTRRMLAAGRGRLVLWALGSRLLAMLAMVAGTYRPRPHDDLHWAHEANGQLFEFVSARWLDVWGRWDTRYYVDIAEHGYGALPSDGSWLYQAAYFPLFPSMMRGLSVLLGGANVYVCGVVLANAFFVGALVYFHRLIRLDATDAIADLTIGCLLAYPGTHFLSCVYPESLALFLGVFSVWCVRSNKWGVAGLACMLAALTRSSGSFVAVPVAYELARGMPGRWVWSPKLLVLALAPLALGWWAAMNAQLFHDPLYFMHVQAGWGRAPSFFLESFFSLKSSLDFHLFTVIAVTLVVLGFRSKQRLGYVVMAALNIALPLSTGSMRGIHRYFASNYPLFAFMAQALEQRPRLRALYVVLGLATMVGFAYRWGQGYQPN